MTHHLMKFEGGRERVSSVGGRPVLGERKVKTREFKGKVLRFKAKANAPVSKGKVGR